MPGDCYGVDYHVIGTIYLDRGRELSGADFARLWSETRVFGDHTGCCAFWHDGNPPLEGLDTRIGSLENVQPLIEGDESLPVFGGGTFAREKLQRGSTIDCDFYLAHTSASRCFGTDTLPEFMMAVSGQWVESTGAEVVLDVLRRQFEIADRYHPRYGLVDIAPAVDGYAGMVYGSTFFLNSLQHRWVEHANWLFGGSKRRDKARGIYWGNYFGAEILEKLGGRERFLHRFRRQAIQSDGTFNARMWEFPNGVFLSVGHDPLKCRPGLPLDAPNLLWLVTELGIHGVLDQWSQWNGVKIDPEGPSESAHLAVALPSQKAGNSANDLQFDELSPQDANWISECVLQARQLAIRYCKDRPVHKLDAKTLDSIHSAWLMEWHESVGMQDPNPVLNALGIAFGEFLVDSLGLRWMRARDNSSDGMGIRYSSEMKPMAVFPTQVFAKRMPTGSTNILVPLYDAIIRPASHHKRRVDKG